MNADMEVAETLVREKSADFQVADYLFMKKDYRLFVYIRGVCRSFFLS